jgi:hypothetical protein
MWRGSPKGAAHSEGGGGTAAAAFDGDDEASVAGNDGSDILQYGADEGGGGLRHIPIMEEKATSVTLNDVRATR